MKDVMSIGELSAFFRLNVQTLHYYDSIGLFRPAVRDPRSRRRAYRFEQVYTLASILYMRKLGYSLKQIERFMETKNTESALAHLKEQSAVLRKKTEELMAVDNAIQRKLRFIEKERQSGEWGKTHIRRCPDRGYIPIGKEEILYKSESFYFYPTIAFYRGRVKLFGAYIFCDGEEEAECPEKTRPEYSRIPEGLFLSGYHYGQYTDVRESEERLRAAGKHLELDGQLVNFNIVDQFVESAAENYVTLMQIRILGGDPDRPLGTG